jgi:hypothetical protein
MNPIWAFLFKDKWRTPFSVYKMSLAEVLVLGGIVFGIGFGITQGAQWISGWGDTVEADG